MTTTPAVEAPRRAAILAAYGYGLLSAAIMGYFLLGIPIQVSDSFGNMLSLRVGWEELVIGQFYQQSYLRPFLWAELKMVYDAAQGNFTPWFRGVHAAQILALVLLYLTLVRPRTWRDAALVPLGVAALLGTHTLEGAVYEAFPVNTFLTILLCCVAAANLSFAPRRWWVDVAAVVLFVVAALTVESGLLVWVIAVGAALVGARGVSKAGLGAMTVLLAGYFVLRFTVLDVGAPELVERSSGFGFRVLDTDELVARFGASPWIFYAYNIVTSALSVLFGEPRAGVFRVLRGISAGTPSAAQLITVAASTLGTVVIGAFIWQRRHAWLRRAFERDDQVVALFVIVLAANAVISYPYTKDVIMSPAGLFYAAALFAAARHVLFRWMEAVRPAVYAGAAAFCLLLATSWAVREVGMHVGLRVTSFKTRNDWGYAEDRFAREGRVFAGEDLQLFQQLRRDALFVYRAPPPLWLAEIGVFDVD